ncbi:hypothetical protein ABVT39_014275 [Epinephelus coioides]
MLAVCESCLPTLSKLRESISGLQADLKERDKILLDFTTVATTQAKHTAHLTAYGPGDRSMMVTNNTILPWTGSITTGTPTPALAESRWHRQRAKPKTSAPSTSCLRPAELQHFIREDGVGAPMTRLRNLYIRLAVPLTSPGVSVRSSSLTPPLHPGQEKPPSCHRCTSKQSETRTWEQHIPSVGDRDLHGQAGINDLRNQQSEVLKQDFVSLVDRLLDMGKWLIISSPLPPPRYGDVTTSRLRQLHLWLKGYCLAKSIPFVDNFTAFLNRPHLFKRDGLHPNQEGPRLLSVNTDLTIRSCTTATS